MRDTRIVKGLKKKRTVSPEFLLLFLMLSILLLMFYINDIVTYIGLKELQTDLTSLNQANSKRDYLYMVAKYKLHKKLYEEKINDGEFSMEELKINSIVSLKEKIAGETTERYEPILPPALFFINVIRFVMGKKQLAVNSEDPATYYLDIAYYFERNKQFKKALEVYKNATALIPDDNDKIPIIQLHEGFCSSIIGDYENARRKYTVVIQENRNAEITKTAKILLRYLDEIREEVDRIKNSTANPGEKGEKLFKLMAYDDAIELLDQAEPENHEEMEKNQYYKARSLEESGEVKKSVEIYQTIITENPDSEYARSSNRRILTIGATNENNKGLKELADKNNSLIRDPGYSGYAETIEEITGESRSLSLDKITEDNSVDKNMAESVLKDGSEQEKENNDFIEDIVKTVVKEDRSYTSKNAAFYELAIKKLEAIKKELEDKNIALEQENKRMERQLNTLLFKTVPNNSMYDNKSKVVTNIDQFGRIISKYTYKTDSSGNLYTESYSIYYYSESNLLYKVIDYDGENNMVAFYFITYDEEGKQVEIRKYDETGRLIYVK